MVAKKTNTVLGKNQRRDYFMAELRLQKSHTPQFPNKLPSPLIPFQFSKRYPKVFSPGLLMALGPATAEAGPCGRQVTRAPPPPLVKLAIASGGPRWGPPLHRAIRCAPLEAGCSAEKIYHRQHVTLWLCLGHDGRLAFAPMNARKTFVSWLD